tara:strand:+ start:38 stop:1075 length:1038 start_codon:yes stop_codon:yes gene_type:complete
MKIGKFNFSNDGVYIIAELSANHNGKIENALKTIKAAKEIGANAIKIQTYTSDTMTLDCKEKDFIVSGGTIWDGISLYELYKQAFTPWEWHKDLFEYARKIGIDIFSSPFDKTAVDFLEQFSPSAYKIASFEITDYDLIRYTAKKGKPMIISTGIATYNEIEDVVGICREENNENIILLKCTSAYPAPLDQANLLTIPDLEKKFNVISGFSDHTLGTTAPIVAVSLGAKVVEKHFILDKSIGGPDSAFSLDKNEFGNMIKVIRDSEKLLGEIRYTHSEKNIKGRQFSRSLYICKDIKAGEKITQENIRSVRPGYGLHPKHLNEVLGKISKRDLKFGDRLKIEDLS